MKNTRDFMYMLALVLSLLTFNANAMEHLCDKWNVLMDSRFELGPINGEVWTEGYQLQGDTTINNMKYSCLMFADVRKNQQSKSWEWVYYGALRETGNAEIYFIPANQSKEYLLFAFNAQAGDRISNLYVMNKDYDTWAIVKDNSETEIILELYAQMGESEDIFQEEYVWVKGIGAKRSMFQPLPNGCGGCVVNFLLCAYSSDKQIYVSETGNTYGCKYRQKAAVYDFADKWVALDIFEDLGPEFIEISEHVYTIERDTIIADNAYKTLWRDGSKYIGALRTEAEGQKVYYNPNGKEYLLMDFALSEGDVVNAYWGDYKAETECKDYWETEHCDTIMPEWKVTDVSIIDGRKHLKVERVDAYRPGITEEWIEGVGTYNIVFPRGLSACLAGVYTSTWTLCAYSGEQQLYSFDLAKYGIINECPEWHLASQDLPETRRTDEVRPQKQLREGRLLIVLPDGRTYDALGRISVE